MKESCGHLVPRPWESHCNPIFLWPHGTWIERTGFPWKWLQMLASYSGLFFGPILTHTDILKLKFSCLAAEVTTTEMA